LIKSDRHNFKPGTAKLIQLNLWKIADTVPSYKRGSRAELNNYRPVSMTNVTGKLMESVI